MGRAPRGSLVVPDDALGVVVFAHGSGCSRFSPRNRHVAHHLQACGIGTLLVDLLTGEEEHDRAAVFDVHLLAERLVAVTEWLRHERAAQGLSIGYFGASTGAAAALWAAADALGLVRAVVSRGGRPDLAWQGLPAVRVPTLLIVGGADHVVLDLHREAARQLRCDHRLDVIPGVTHLFEESGALAQVATHAVVVRALLRRSLIPASATPAPAQLRRAGAQSRTGRFSGRELRGAGRARGPRRRLVRRGS